MSAAGAESSVDCSTPMVWSTGPSTSGASENRAVRKILFHSYHIRRSAAPVRSAR